LPLQALKSCTAGNQGDADLDAISRAASAAVDYACHGGGDNIVSKFIICHDKFYSKRLIQSSYLLVVAGTRRICKSERSAMS
jgi:hypothetical protein